MGTSVIRLPIKGEMSVIIDADDGTSIDRVYLSDGHLFVFDDQGSVGTSTVSMTTPACSRPTHLPSNSRIIAGCAKKCGLLKHLFFTI
jgi:hypothetical protein